MNSQQKAVWVAVGLILVVLSMATILQARAIFRLQDATAKTSPAWSSDLSGLRSDSRRIDDLERQVEADRWQAERQRREDKAEREAEEADRSRERQRERGW